MKNKGRILHYNPWNFDAEPGDIMVGMGRAWRLYERSAAGELCMREIKRPGKIAEIKEGRLMWVDKYADSNPARPAL